MFGLALPDYFSIYLGYDVSGILSEYFERKEIYLTNEQKVLKLHIQDAFKFKTIREAFNQEMKHAVENNLSNQTMFGSETAPMPVKTDL